MSTAAIAVIARRKKIIRTFRNAGATDLAHAIDPGENGIRESFLFNKMVGDGIFVNRGDGRFFLDEEREEELTGKRRKMLFVLLCIVLLTLLAGVYMAKMNTP